MMQLFKAERQLLDPHLQQQRGLFLSLGISALAGCLLPIVFNAQLPKELKTMSLLSSVACSTALSVASGNAVSRKQSKIAQTLEKAQDQRLKTAIAHEIAYTDITGRIEAENRLLAAISSLPVEQQRHYLAQLGLQGIAPYQYSALQEITVEAQHVPGPNTLQELEVPEEDAGDLSPAQLYSHCIKKSVLFAGNPREGKTVAAHYALHQWAQQDPELVIYAFDKHLGMNNDPKFASNWLGVPQLNSIPKNVQTCAIKGGPKDLERFLSRVQKLFQYRNENNINTPQVVVLIDEFTNQLGVLTEDEVKAIERILSEIATEAPKFGINFWLILHSLTKEDLGNLSRKVLRACHVVMGAEMTQDKAQVANCPRTLQASAIDYGQSIYREIGGLPAGFVTSLPVANGYLPPPPLKSLEELKLEWVQPAAAAPEQPTEQAVTPTGDIYAVLAAWVSQLSRIPTDQEIQAKWAELGHGELSEDAIGLLLTKIAAASPRDGGFSEFYSLYLKSGRWKAKRQQVLERDGHQCCTCSTRDNLEVHHKTYDRLGCESLEDLITLCKGCHVGVTWAMKRGKK